MKVLVEIFFVINNNELHWQSDDLIKQPCVE